MTGRTLAAPGLLTLALTLVLLTAGGCGTDRSAAPDSPVLLSDQGIWVRDLASSGVGPLAQDSQPSTDRGLPGSSAAPRAASSVQIDGALGGVVEQDRVTVLIPPGAFSGRRMISLDVVSADGYIECHLFPEGLKFDQPVQLNMSLLNTSGDDEATTIYWYDPDTGTWVDMLGVYDTSTHSVVAQLRHFSTYRAGRAGW